MNIPIWFVPGLQFRSDYINSGYNECKLISIDEATNTCKVDVKFTKISMSQVMNSQIMERPLLTEFTDEWQLDHTIYGFERGDYIQLNQHDYLTAEEFDLQIP